MTAVARLASHYLAQDQMLVAESHVNMFISNLRKGPLEVNVLMHAKINFVIYGGSFITYFTIS